MRKVLFLVCVLTSSGRIQSATIHVPADYSTIQEGIDAAADGDTVLVAAGEYVIKAPINFNGKAITVASETGAEEATIRMSENPDDSDKASVVIFESGETGNSVLEGLTITGGSGTLLEGPSKAVEGGGIFCRNDSSPSIKNCVITNNYALYGGGIYCGNSTAALIDCTITGNSASTGGGICFSFSSSLISSCMVIENSARRGGGVYCRYESSPVFTDCTITNNIVSPIESGFSCSGAGFSCSNSSPEFSNCFITGNACIHEDSAAGGFHCISNSSPILNNCVISGNSASFGSGFVCSEYSSPSLTNCTLTGNWAYDQAVIYCYRSSPHLKACTITGNMANQKSAGIKCKYSPFPVLQNCIVWNNGGASFYSDDEDSQPDVSFSCIEGEVVWLGEGNINADPQFCGWSEKEVHVSNQHELDVALSSFSYSLSTQSPCIGAGKDGSDMGAATGRCTEIGQDKKLIHLSPGTYSMIKSFNLFLNVSIEGAGEEETIIEGTVYGLRTGARFSDITVSKGIHGGICVGKGESPAISNCTITSNSAQEGSGISCYKASPQFHNCTITHNFAQRAGGGVYCYDASPQFTSCTISTNWASLKMGGGICCIEGASPTFMNCSIINNANGGVYCENDCAPKFDNCTISGNSNSGGEGGGIHCYDQVFPEFINCTITSNYARYGGAVYSMSASNPLFLNCIISGNSAFTNGGICYSSHMGLFTFSNCTITHNFCNHGSGVHINSAVSSVFKNCILWGNIQPPHDRLICVCVENGDPKISFSSIEDDEIWAGEGNINKDPLFKKSGVYDFERHKEVTIAGYKIQLPDFVVQQGDYRLQNDSPCIDSGTSEAAPVIDIEGNPRPTGEGFDMGAFEYLTRFVRGDANTDGKVNLADPIYTLNTLFRSGPNFKCMKSADANDNGEVELADAIYLVHYFFSGGEPPPAPFPDCGMDPTIDDLTCEASSCE